METACSRPTSPVRMISTFRPRLQDNGVMNAVLNFSHAFAASGFPHLCAVRGYDTPEECRAWFAGQRTRFDRLDEWLDDTPLHGVLADRQDGRGFYLVALKDYLDAVHFTLRWAITSWPDGLHGAQDGPPDRFWTVARSWVRLYRQRELPRLSFDHSPSGWFDPDR